MRTITPVWLKDKRTASRTHATERPTSAISGGGGGIRTPETLSSLTVFKTAGFNRSPTPPVVILAHSVVQECMGKSFWAQREFLFKKAAGKVCNVRSKHKRSSGQTSQLKTN